jgi:hypothetical protein
MDNHEADAGAGPLSDAQVNGLLENVKCPLCRAQNHSFLDCPAHRDQGHIFAEHKTSRLDVGGVGIRHPES